MNLRYNLTQVQFSVSAYYQLIFIFEYHKLQSILLKILFRMHLTNLTKRTRIQFICVINYEVLTQQPINIYLK